MGPNPSIPRTLPAPNKPTPQAHPPQSRPELPTRSAESMITVTFRLYTPKSDRDHGCEVGGADRYDGGI